MNYFAMIDRTKTPVLYLLFLLLLQAWQPATAVAQDKLPVREYTNPDEVVTFDRNTSFPRALDVINEFAQEYVGKIVLDRTGTDESLGISIPPMHWRDALDLILRVKGLVMIEQRDYFEIVSTPQPRSSGGGGGQQQQASIGPGGQPLEDLLATTDSREVRINAIFFEGNRRALREIGVDWSTLTANVPDIATDYFGDEADAVLPATSGFNNQFVTVSSQGAQSVSQSVFSSLINVGEIGTSGIEVQALISAFEADNLGEVLASPSVKVMDGQEGFIQVGQDFSIKQRDFAGNVTDQFFNTGTILTVTPTIIEQNDTTFIHVDVAAEKSSAQPDPVSTIVNKQQATTQAILLDGEATAIAGLYSSENTEVRRGIPILKDLPPWFFGLRYLFGYNSTDYQMRELVILVQAEIEPSIPQRYGKRFEDKFKLLNDERRRIRTEIDDYEDYNPDRRRRYDEEPEVQEEADSMAVDAEEEPGEATLAAAEEEQIPEEEQPEEDEQPIIDPEVRSEPVVLDLGEEEMPMDQQDEAEMDSAGVEEGQEEPMMAETMETEEPEETEPETGAETAMDQGETAAGGSADLRYYVIGASFANESNATAFREKLSGEGFDAVILTNPESGIHYVSYRGFDDLDLAKTGLIDIREYYNADAWLYKTTE